MLVWGASKEKGVENRQNKKPKKRHQKDMNRKWRICWDALDARSVQGFEKHLKSKILLENLD